MVNYASAFSQSESGAQSAKAYSGAAKTHTIINKWRKGRDSLSRFRKTKAFPVGHPIIETEFHASTLDKWAQVVVITYGLVQCRVQPHRDLFESVLRMRKTNKVPFALCPMSVDEELQHPWNEQSCKYPNLDKDRQFISTWWSEELKLALQERYHGMWDFLNHARAEITIIRGRVQSDGWPSRQIGDDPEFHATSLREYFLQEVSSPDRIEKILAAATSENSWPTNLGASLARR